MTFQKADLVLLNKSDLMPHLPEFDITSFEKALTHVMPGPRYIAVSARTGRGVEQWLPWLKEQALKLSNTDSSRGAC